MRKLNSTWLALFSLLLAGSAAGWIGIHAWPVADDFANANWVRSMNPLSFMVDAYFKWTGRAPSSLMIGLVLSGISNLTFLNTISVALGVLWFANIGLGIRWVFPDLDRTRRLAATAFLGAVTWRLAQSITPEVVFWVTGGLVYQLPITFFLIWAVQLQSLNRNNKKQTRALLGMHFVLGFLAGCGIELLTVGSALLIATYIGQAPDRPRFIRQAKGLIGGWVMGALVLIGAPGNFVRAKYVTDSFNVSSPGLWAASKRVLTFLWTSQGALIGLALGVAIILAIGTLFVGTKALPKLKLAALHCFGLILMTMASYLPMLVVPSFVAPRTLLYLIFLLSLAVSVGIAEISTWVFKSKAISVWLLLVMAFWGGGRIWRIAINENGRAASVQDCYAQRQEELKLKRGSNGLVEVSPCNRDLPSTLHFNDVVVDASNWVNVAVAKYYGLEKIGLAQTLTK